MEAKATRVVIAIFGVLAGLAGLAGIEHGIGEINQGSIRPASLIMSRGPMRPLSPFLAVNRH